MGCDQALFNSLMVANWPVVVNSFGWVLNDTVNFDHTPLLVQKLLCLLHRKFQTHFHYKMKFNNYKKSHSVWTERCRLSLYCQNDVMLCTAQKSRADGCPDVHLMERCFALLKKHGKHGHIKQWRNPPSVLRSWSAHCHWSIFEKSYTDPKYLNDVATEYIHSIIPVKTLNNPNWIIRLALWQKRRAPEMRENKRKLFCIFSALFPPKQPAFYL